LLQGRLFMARKSKQWIIREGKLGGPGYLSKSQAQRRKILDKCVKQYGYRSCLGSVMVLNRNRTIAARHGAKIDADKEYLKKKYGGPGSFGPRKRVAKGKMGAQAGIALMDALDRASSAGAQVAVQSLVRDNILSAQDAKEERVEIANNLKEYLRVIHDFGYAPPGKMAAMSPRDRAALATSPKFRKYMQNLTGKTSPSYEEVRTALIGQGLDRKTAAQYALFATDNLSGAPQGKMRARQDLKDVVISRGTIKIGTNKPLKIKKIGQGMFAKAYATTGKRPRVFLEIPDDAGDYSKEILSEVSADTRSKYLPKTKKIGYTNTADVFEQPLYKAPLRKADSAKAWKEYRTLEKCWNEALRKVQRGRGREWIYEGYNLQNLVRECAKANQLSPALIRALELITDASANYGSTYSFEFSPRNLATDSKGNLILLDVLFDLETVQKRRSAAAQKAPRGYMRSQHAGNPAEKSERIKGSKRNPTGSAATGKNNIKFSAATTRALQKKSKESGINLGTLKAVYRRGAGAFSTSHRPGMTRGRWAMARVNAFIQLAKTGKPKNPKYIQDNDLLPKGVLRADKTQMPLRWSNFQ
jgi:hypothetical protein